MLNIYFILSLIFIHLNRRNIRDGQQLDGEWIFFFNTDNNNRSYLFSSFHV